MLSKKLLSTILSVVLVVGLLPLPASADQAGSADDEVAASIEGTPGVDYVEGQVLVAVRGGQEALSAATDKGGFSILGLGASDPYPVVESLTTVSASDLSQAADEAGATDEVNLASSDDDSEGAGASSGDSDGDSSSVDNPEGNYSALSVDDDAIEILLLSCDDVAQAIADLEKLDCVAMAQPNYLYSLVDDESSTVEGTDDAEATNVSQANTTSVLGGSALTTESASADGSASTSDRPSTEGATMSAENSAQTTTTGGTSEPFYAAQWSLESASNLATSGYPSTTTNLNVEGAWAAGAGDEDGGDVVVAVIDCGVDYTHEDLKGSMWTGGDAAWSTALGGGTYGYNSLASGSRNDPMDKFGHGTHCASIIAAAWNGTGIAGINNKVKIMAVKAVAAAASDRSTSASQILAFNYVITAKQNGVNVVAENCSFGPGTEIGYSDLLQSSMIYKAGEAGIITVFSAGNDAWDNDAIPIDQQGNSNPYLIYVGALNSANGAAAFSEWGARAVDVFSPGTRVLAATTTYNARQGVDTGLAAQFTPWLTGSASSKSAYVVDDAATTTRADGIKYDLVSINEDYKVTASFGEAKISTPGYINGATSNNASYRFDLQGVTLQEGEDLAVRMTIPAATWKSYVAQGKGNNLYVAAIGNFAGFGTGTTPTLTVCTFNGKEWGVNPMDSITAADGNWYNLSTLKSLSDLDAGKDADGNVTIFFKEFDNSGTTLTSNNYICLDNVSLGWTTCENYGTSSANGTYYYSNGTSMAAPNTTGTVSLLCSKAKVASGSSTGYLQTAETAREIAAFVKGGVTQLDTLSDKCKTGGVVNAQTSYSAYATYKSAATETEKLAATASLKPVSDTITDNADGTYTLKGSFFGSARGSVKFGDTTLEVKEWTDSAITFNSPTLEKETIGKVIVTKANGVSGQSRLVMPATSDTTRAFAALPNPDFEFTYTNTGTDGQVTTLTVNANTVTPLKMAAAAGYIYVYGSAAADEVLVLMRYCVATGTWDEVNYLADYADQICPSNDRLMSSMVAGKSEIYLQVRTKVDGVSAARLLTIKAATGQVVHNVTLDNSLSKWYGCLGFYDGVLYEVGGETGEPVCRAIFPDTGAVWWSSAETLTVDTCYGTVTNNGSGLTITGSYRWSMADLTGYRDGMRNQEIDITFGDDGTVKLATSSSVFFPGARAASEYGLDTGQRYSTVAATAVDGGVLMTGPVRDNETANMVDTWIYSTSTQKWNGVTKARFAPAIESSACSCTWQGIYYVMAEDLQEANVYQRFGSFPLEKLGLSDTAVTPASDALEQTAVGDVNDNGIVNILDAQIVIDMANGKWTDKTAYDKLLEALAAKSTDWDEALLIRVADVNRDKIVDAEDARAIQHYVHTGSFVEAA